MLKGDLKDYGLIIINGNCRVIFHFEAIDVELVDYRDYH
nr:type II toxin-antitoxin system RelE/ParE family toxin [Bartonella sp. MM73XJBT.G]